MTDLQLQSLVRSTEPQTDPRILNIEREGKVTKVTLKDADPNFLHVSAEGLQGWTWKFSRVPDAEEMEIVADEKQRHITVSGRVNGINKMTLTVQEIRTVGLPCASARPMVMTEAGVFMLHPQIRAKVGDVWTCYVGSGVVYLNSPKEIQCTEIFFGQHWGAAQAEVIQELWGY